jgi:hypothetical protein
MDFVMPWMCANNLQPTRNDIILIPLKVGARLCQRFDLNCKKPKPMRLNILFVLYAIGVVIPASAQWQISPAVVEDQLIVTDIENEINDLLLIDDLLLLAGDYNDLPACTATDLAWFDGYHYTPFEPELNTQFGNNTIYQLIDHPQGIIAVGRLPYYNGAAQLIDSSWVSIGLPGTNKLFKIFEFDDNLVSLKQGYIYQYTNGNWLNMASAPNVSIDDIQTHNDRLYAIGNDTLWLYDASTWQALSVDQFVPQELSTAGDLLFCAGWSSSDETNQFVQYLTIEENNTAPFTFNMEVPLIIGSVLLANGEWIITDAKDHNTFEVIPTRMLSNQSCYDEPHHMAPSQVVEYQNSPYAAMHGLLGEGLFRLENMDLCQFLTNDSITTRVLPQATILSESALNRAGLIFNRDSGIFQATIYSSAIWMSGVTTSDTIVTANTYGQMSNQFFGPVCHELTSAYYKKYGRTYQVRRSQIEQHLASYSNPFYIMPEVIANWPAHGDATNGEAHDLAPFVDSNNNGQYEPELGDYPAIKGDVCSYFILNDCRSKLDDIGDTESLLPDSLAVEDHVMLYIFESDLEALHSTVFVEHTFINRSDRIYDEFKCGIWTDFDIGSAQDDYVGCDSLRNCYYGYNGDAFDEASASSSGFGSMTKSAGCVVLNQTMDHAMYYNIGTNPINGDPAHWLHFYNYLHGKWKNGAPLLYGGNGVSGTNVTQTPANYMFPSDPASNNASDWNEITSNNQAGDRRMFCSVEAVTLAPGQHHCLHYAIVHGAATAPSDTAHIESAHRLLENVDKVQAFYNQHLNTCLRQEVVASSGNGTNSGSWFNVYPNPGEDYMALSLPYDGQTYYLRVYNAIGQLVYNNQFIANDPFQALSTSTWANGLYVVQLSGNSLKEKRKWLKAQ